MGKKLCRSQDEKNFLMFPWFWQKKLFRHFPRIFYNRIFALSFILWCLFVLYIYFSMYMITKKWLLWNGPWEPFLKRFFYLCYFFAFFGLFAIRTFIIFFGGKFRHIYVQIIYHWFNGFLTKNVLFVLVNVWNYLIFVKFF